MKTLQQFITEKILINKNSKIAYNYHPKTKDKLKYIINKRIKAEEEKIKQQERLKQQEAEEKEIKNLSDEAKERDKKSNKTSKL